MGFTWKHWVGIILGSCLLVAFVFWAENRPKLEEGTIIEKEFIPAHTERSTVPVMHRVGKVTITNMIPVTRHYDDQWTITFEGYLNDKHTVRTVYVTEVVYNSYNLGDTFVYDKDRDSDEERYEEICDN